MSPSGTRLYNISSFLSELITQNDISTTSVTEKKGFLYTRVSSRNKKKTLKDRNRSLNPDSQIMSSSVISGQVSTSKEIDLKPYWNDQVKEWSQKLCSKNFKWIKPHTLNEKLKLYINVKEGKYFNKKNKKLQRSCVWEECKFLRTVVWLELRVKGLHDKVPANIIDESIDEALIARKNIIQKNLKETKKSSLSFKSKKDLRQTMTVHVQNFSKKDWKHFYITYLHNSLTLSSK
ncbi:3271_t:CDS:2 [Cetraspora pellucida]|uniref:3271_t:CDS:1 n=1 Tax=Cetraspora pellucida TaxID=1433469 RepID=A0ACA9LHI9_9GLOM|nr:3271_t:CDS:2 [Cetraspora pellucida]